MNSVADPDTGGFFFFKKKRKEKEREGGLGLTGFIRFAAN